MKTYELEPGHKIWIKFRNQDRTRPLRSVLSKHAWIFTDETILNRGICPNSREWLRVQCVGIYKGKETEYIEFYQESSKCIY